MITLYDYWRSSASYRVRIALRLAGADYTAIPMDLMEGAQREAANLARNPQGLVPTLEVDGAVLTQSLAIIEYLNDTRDLHFLPDAPLERARVRALAYAIAMEIHPICNLRTAKHAAAASGGAIEMKQWMQDFIGPGLAAVETMLDGGDYCIGERVSLADICLAPQVYNAKRWEVDMSAMPKIARVMAHLETLKPFIDALPENTPH